MSRNWQDKGDNPPIDTGAPSIGNGVVHSAVRVSAQLMENTWKALCERYLPTDSDDAMWRFSRLLKPDDPEQGWKLHISATLLTANDVLQTVAPFLQTNNVLFKAPVSLLELSKINSGLYYGYSQVGKFITVYPRSNEEAVYLAQWLHQLTSGRPAPVVPFDMPFRPGSCVYYRYGAFKPLVFTNPDGGTTPAIRNPEGELIPDSRESWASGSAWMSDPFLEGRTQCKTETIESPLKTTFRVFRALTQRGKGGVYQALDLSVAPPRFCLLKEGRRNGEVGWDGRDGHWRVRNEKRILSRLQAAGLDVPRIYAAFEVEGHYYLATEFIAGETLQFLLGKRQKRLSIIRALQYTIQIAEIISQFHAIGWAWRDCKPANLIVTPEGRLKPVDFEGACPLNQSDPLPWRTPDFTPPEQHGGELYGDSGGGSDDLYAIGAIFYFLLTGRIPAASSMTPVAKLRRNLPAEIIQLIAELLDLSPERRPSATIVVQRLKCALSASNA